MTPKKKAKELVNKFRPYTKIIVANAEYIENTKICALIAVDEILGYMGADRGYAFWEEVKQEINKL